MLKPYHGESEYRGYGTMSDEQVYESVLQAAREGRQILAHCNGDAACAQFIEACERVNEAYPVSAIRPVIVHGQLLRPQQLNELGRLGIIPSFFVAHVYHWGDVHIQNFGLERASQISPARAALLKDIPFTFHQDSPVIQPDMLETIWCAVCRKTRAGKTLGDAQRIAVLEALRAVTTHAARQYFEEGEKGRLRPGMRADLVVLDADPLITPLNKLREIRVKATFAAGECIHCMHEKKET